MKSGLAAIAILILALSAGAAPAEPLDTKAVVAALVESTWQGTNDQGERFRFRHSGGPDAGGFAAEFAAESEVLARARGTWARQSDRICWHWPGSGATHCYVRFEREGNRLTMTREDGVVHSGVLREGESGKP